jgi:hypothetical protein
MVELEEAARRLSLEVGDVVPMVTVGSPAATIIRIATEEECDLIAMSSHGRGTIARGLLGSVSDDVVRNSYIPTMVFAPRKADEDWSESAEIDRMIVPLDGSRYAEAAVPYVEEMARRMDRISAPEYGLGSCRSQHPKSLYQDRQQRAFQRFFADIDSVGLFGAYRSNTQQPMMRVMRS